MKKEKIIKNIENFLKNKIKIDIYIDNIYMDKNILNNNVLYVKIKDIRLKEKIEIQDDMFNTGFGGLKESILYKLESILNKYSLFNFKFIDKFDEKIMSEYKEIKKTKRKKAIKNKSLF